MYVCFLSWGAVVIISFWYLSKHLFYGICKQISGFISPCATAAFPKCIMFCCGSCCWEISTEHVGSPQTCHPLPHLSPWYFKTDFFFFPQSQSETGRGGENEQNIQAFWPHRKISDTLSYTGEAVKQQAGIILDCFWSVLFYISLYPLEVCLLSSSLCGTNCDVPSAHLHISHNAALQSLQRSTFVCVEATCLNGIKRLKPH